MSFTTLVDAATLAAHRGDPDWRIIDVRHQLADVGYGERVYAEGHLPAAFFLHLDRDLSGPLTGRNGRHPLPDIAALVATFGRLGITPQTQVVAYDDAGGMMAARLWWLLRWLGHERVAVLDGGLPAWLAAGGELSQTLPTVVATDFAAAPRPEVLSADAVLAKLGQPDCLLVDARAPDRFRGENETLDPRGGHIPGACNRFFRDNLKADGSFKPAEQLREEWLALFAGQAVAQVVNYCGSGVTACHNLLAQAIAGLPGARIYAGSWSEWCSDPDRPLTK
ncbi:MAG: hypothetical protein RIR00_2696 [Pseudomonadota bacterium]|jgi:thiosulfate/3-mercaptopyruvate sulfurtransferase